MTLPHPAHTPALEHHTHGTACLHCPIQRTPWRLECVRLPAPGEGCYQLTHLLLDSHCKTDPLFNLRCPQVRTRQTAQGHPQCQVSGATRGSWPSCHFLGYWENLGLQLTLSSFNPFLPSPVVSAALPSLPPSQDQDQNIQKGLHVAQVSFTESWILDKCCQLRSLGEITPE